MTALAVTTADLAAAMSVPKSTVIRRAQAEGWAYSEELGRGGMRRLYSVEQLPAALRAKLMWRGASPDATPETRAAAQAGRATGAALALRSTIEAVAAQTMRQTSLRQAGELDAKSQARIDARLAVVRAFEQFAASVTLATAAARAVFAQRYNAAAVVVAPAVRTLVPTTSDSSIERWQRDIRTRGITALAGNYGNRASASKVDSHPELREFVQAVLMHNPHARATQVLAGLRARFKGQYDLPSIRAVERYTDTWRKENAEIMAALSNPDGWRNKYMTAFGSRSEGITRRNQRWELDSSPADVMCTDGRYSLIGGIDVWGRRPRLLVAKTSKAVAVAALLRRMLLDLGVPEEAKTDNGSDYVSQHVTRVFASLDVTHTLCEPFCPDQKPHIERFFGTFHRGLAELLPGFIGHSVAERKAIESRKSFAERLGTRGEVVDVALSGKDLQAFCDEWIDSVYMHSPHGGLGDRSPFEVDAACADEVRRIADAHALDVLLAEAPENNGRRTVLKKGIRLDNAWFIAPELHAWVGEQVHVRYDALDHDLGRLYVFGYVAGQGDQQFICIAECPERTGMDRREVAAKGRALQREHMGAARRAAKGLVKRMGTARIAEEVLKDKAAAQGKLTVLPGRSVAHTSAGLSAAAATAKAARAPQRTTADIEDLAQVQATRARLAEAAAPKRPALAAVPATPVFETVGQRVQWLLTQQHGRALTADEAETLAGFRRTQPASYRRMTELEAEQLGSAKENAPGAVAGQPGAV